MASELLMPNDVIDKLTCTSCKNYLAIFPIYLMGTENAAVCGRCQVVKDDYIIRDEAFESLAQYLVFPCANANNGCKENYCPADLRLHESTCEYRQFDCPSKHYSKCEWQGSSKTLADHFEKDHPAQFIKDFKFEVNFSSSQKENMLLVYENTFFIVNKEIDSRKNFFWCSVKNILVDDESNKYNYRLILESGNRNYSHKFPEKNTTSLSDENLTKVDASLLQERLGEPETIIARIEIQKASTANVSINKPEAEDKEVNLELLRELECPNCKEYMVGDIYQCHKGHSVCDNCRSKNCIVCSEPIQDTKNYSLQKFANFFDFPCKYRKTGCKFTGKNTEIKTHEKYCKFGPYNCPLAGFVECAWKDNVAEIISHAEKVHNDMILKSDRINIDWKKDSMPNTKKCSLILFSGSLFRLIFKYENDKMYWCVQCVGPAENCKDLKYEIDFIDNSDDNLRHFLRHKVMPLAPVDESFQL
ncbi:unnamed protein product [Brassicogethes aeneus]|uniref:RING-type E3 ubiquitin transferase n=1 Tax=Brassicogethes aeneus TaxID=1431903 RepID=A0A9P0FLF7_BRAAE|nr:unnamed protein product [Brassicogethes aeneus]